MTETRSGDLLSSSVRLLVLYGLPVLAINLAANFGGRTTITVVWTSAFATMGLACVQNARSCGRVHCFFTGPLFLAAAAISLLHGARVVDLGPSGWGWIGGVTLVLALLLYLGPEAIWGRYFGSRRA